MKKELKEKRAWNFVRKSDILLWILVSSLLWSFDLGCFEISEGKYWCRVFIQEHFPKEPLIFGIINTVIPAKYWFLFLTSIMEKNGPFLMQNQIFLCYPLLSDPQKCFFCLASCLPLPLQNLLFFQDAFFCCFNFELLLLHLISEECKKWSLTNMQR